MQRLLFKQWFITTVALAVFVVTTALSYRLNLLEQQRAEQLLHSLVVNQASAVRARLESEINSTLHLTRGLTAFVATHPDISHEQFNSLAAEIIANNTTIRNIGLAPDNVIRFIYPLQGNEAALGLNYLEKTDQRDAVLRASETGKTVVAGPVNLVQGGTAFINRTPIYANGGHPSEPHQHRYWGLASVVINMPELFAAAGLTTEVDGTRFALRGKDGLGAAGAPFFGEANLFGQDPVLLPINLPEGSWQLAAVPVNGWHPAMPYLQLYLLGSVWLALLLALLVYRVLKERQQIEHLALHDHLTGMPNRRLFDLRLEHALERTQRDRQVMAVLYLDLDGFKVINDRYGHKAGDQVLVEVCWRIHTILRRSDTIARIGGDECLILL